jgi:hypothetical protein
VKGDTFNIVNFNGIAVFKRNEMKKVTGVHIDASGYVLDGIKDSVAVHINAMIGMRSFPSSQLADNEKNLVLDETAAKNFYRRRVADDIIE